MTWFGFQAAHLRDTRYSLAYTSNPKYIDVSDVRPPPPIRQLIQYYMRHAIEFVYANIQEQHVAENSRNIECSNSIAGVAACLIHREMRSINMHGSGRANASM